MTRKAAIIVGVAAVAATGLFATIWWRSSQLPPRVSVAEYMPGEEAVPHNLPATRPSMRMSLPWPATATNAPPVEEVAGGTAPSRKGSLAGKPQSSAALPWSGQAKGERHVVEMVSSAPSSLTESSVAETATKLKFSPTVVAWLSVWESKRRSGNSVEPSDLAEFERLLNAENVAVDKLLALMRSTQTLEDFPRTRHSSPYPPVSAAIACRAVEVGVEQAKDGNRRYLAMNQISPLIERLWCGTSEHSRAVQVFYEALAKYEPVGSPDWHRGQVGAIEALTCQKRYAEALERSATLESVMPRMSPQQAAAVEYAKGVALYGAKQYAASAEALAHVSQSLEGTKRSDSIALRVMALSYVGRVADAELAYKQLLSEATLSPLTDQAHYVLKHSSDTEQKGRADVKLLK